MDKLNISNFGPIKEANVAFGDLTFIVGPQATGKSLFLELLKLIIDKNHIIPTLKKYNYILSKNDARNIIECYFGEGMSTLFRHNTSVDFNGKVFEAKELLKSTKSFPERVFYVPAQRILSMSDGRPKNFMEFDISTPYPLRSFSETLRVFMQSGLGNPDVIFPMKTRLKGATKKSINETIFHDAKVVIDQNSGQRKMKLDVDGMRIPFMAWSAGQKEFMPLLLAFYCLVGPPSQVTNQGDYKWAIIEEPEMGLHPKAIESVLIEIIELMKMNYKVVVSTHSTTFLDFAWTFNSIKKNDDQTVKKALGELFRMQKNTTVLNLFDEIKERTIKTYYSAKSNADGVVFTDISSLDACDDNLDISEWGGLSSFAGRASEVVSKYNLIDYGE